VNTWYDYRAVWSAHPWVLAIAVVAVALIAVAVVETIDRGPLAFLFIPGLAAIYVHHLIVMKKSD
jgi:hypothetical protein